MGIIDRAKRAISSNVNSLIDKAEDPRKMVDQSLLDMKEQMKRAKQEVVTAVAEEKQLRRKCDELQAQMDKWVQRAELAVKAGDDALAREALKQKARISEELRATEQRREEQLGLALKMRDDLQAMERRHQVLSSKKGTIAAKAEIAKAGGGSEALGSRGGENAFDTFRGIEEKIENDEAQVDAMRELQSDEMKEAELESKFRRLERGDSKGPGAAPSAVDDELSALKARVRVKADK